MITNVRRASRVFFIAIVLAGVAAGANAQDIPRGTIIDEVKCATDPAQTYALYVPSGYSTERKWNLLIGLHPAARGRQMVETYAAAAERYGYIVAGSNVSRNGPWSESVTALQAMLTDLGGRFSLDPRRVYVTGLSGGARVALQVALAGNNVAGVIASSAEEIDGLEANLQDESRHDLALMQLRDRLSKLSSKASSPGDSFERRQARRVLRAVSIGAAGRVKDRGYLALVEEYARLPR